MIYMNDVISQVRKNSKKAQCAIVDKKILQKRDVIYKYFLF